MRGFLYAVLLVGTCLTVGGCLSEKAKLVSTTQRAVLYLYEITDVAKRPAVQQFQERYQAARDTGGGVPLRIRLSADAVLTRGIDLKVKAITNRPDAKHGTLAINAVWVKAGGAHTGQRYLSLSAKDLRFKFVWNPADGSLRLDSASIADQGPDLSALDE